MAMTKKSRSGAVTSIKPPRILLVDIETSPLIVYAWSLWDKYIPAGNIVEPGHTLCFTAKWLGESEVIFHSTQRSKQVTMLRRIHKLLDEADAVIHYNGCVVAGNRVLTKDLRWIPVETLVEGDELLAFQEEASGPNKPRKYEVSRVVKAAPIIKPCSRITLEDGTTIIASDDHPWLTYKTSAKNLDFVNTEDLVGGVMVKALDVWNDKESYASGYLSAFFDGEGCLNQTRRRRNTESEEYVLSCTFAQKDDTITSKLLASLEQEKFKYTVTRPDKDNTDMKSVRITGGVPELLKFLGSVRPSKLSRLDYSKLQHAKLCVKESIKVVSVEKLGDMEVVGLETTSKTYIVEGFPCHNTKFDIPVLEAEFLLHGMPPPSPFAHIDLLQTTRRFRLPSRKLDYICQALDIGSKTSHKGMDLWRGCMDGDAESWEIMEKYNRQDVKLLEELYYVLRPWLKNHINLAIGSSHAVCPVCGSHSLRWKGYRRTSTAIYKRFVCNDCGRWGQSTASERGLKAEVK